MASTQLNTTAYPGAYYLQETMTTKNYGNVLLTNKKCLSGNILLDITAKDGTMGTPSITYNVSNVNNQSKVTVTPSVTNDEGWISGGTITGTPVEISAGQVVSGDVTITQRTGQDVTNYATVTVQSGSITGNSNNGATKILDASATSFPYYASISAGWFDTCRIKISATFDEYSGYYTTG